MSSEVIENIIIQKPEPNNPIPYHLLLLADPYKPAIDKYVKDSEIYITILKSEIIGVYALFPVTETAIEIKNIAVNETWQGRGIGTLMLAHAAQTAKAKNYKTLLIGTGNSSINELRFYQRQGFDIFDIKKDFFVNNYPDPIFEDGIQCKHMIMLKKQL